MDSEGLHRGSTARTAAMVRLRLFQRTLALRIVLGEKPGAEGLNIL